VVQSLHYRFFLSGSRHHLPLHSFPTRRSSDLRPMRAPISHSTKPATARLARGQRFIVRFRSVSTARIVSRTMATAPGERRRRLRSEEHTSELQSLAYLVCRLLLEKKKQKATLH